MPLTVSNRQASPVGLWGVGATTTTYSPVGGGVGKFLRGVVTATNTSGVVSAVSAATDAVLAE